MVLTKAKTRVIFNSEILGKENEKKITQLLAKYRLDVLGDIARAKGEQRAFDDTLLDARLLFVVT